MLSSKIQNFTYRYKYNAWWLLAVYHDSSQGDYFSLNDNERNPLWCDKPNLYSIMGEINDRFKIDGKYEFLLEYPSRQGFNRWRQTFSPNDVKETTSTADIGFTYK